MLQVLEFEHGYLSIALDIGDDLVFTHYWSRLCKVQFSLTQPQSRKLGNNYISEITVARRSTPLKLP
jgi:hypothetical protein